MLRSALQAARRSSLERQREQVYQTGFPQCAEIGHAVNWRLRRRGKGRGCSMFGAMLAAVATAKNWMGIPRIAKLIGYSPRQCQRFRAELEADGYIRSESLEAGDLLEGMRAPAWRPWVIRDVTPLQQMAAAALAPERKPRKPSAAEYTAAAAASGTVSTTGPASVKPRAAATTAAEFSEIALHVAPEFAAFFHGMAAAASKRSEQRQKPAAPPPPPAMDPSEIDAIDRELREIERGPPPRGS